MTSGPTSALIIRGGARFGGGRSAPLTAAGGRIVDLDPGRAATGDTVTIDADGLIVAPGFVDLQINGGHGIDLATEPEAMWDLARLLPRYGVTSFLPTIISSPPTITNRALAAHGALADERIAVGLIVDGVHVDPVAAASTTPAAVIGATDRGQLRPGAVADIVFPSPTARWPSRSVAASSPT